ncbi:metal ABC transporter ATP-binding protein [Pseudanabaena sp. FACHB-2040]|uniref:metal ABC transporter ATP-binding protein n=1 Tax=Pseudanabaena sp. FACHB-2040 TaxID=2692859 RepID=UPI0016868500|nr:metal ABC transporter ATP-binding protein [Pseudanabaena sp. FACHB-2040]MBD0269815.1 metal ABC transporter ATP-binding protein [Cyanobacteria bacterium Co-bin8]MBD2258171.1 metal ABC transporter ATP-binding protein [Pseudanabaena sp. FACHB-2040]
MLETQRLSVNYRGIPALQEVSLVLEAGQMVGLIGPNGAGKSTLIKAVLGLVPGRGQVLFRGAPLKRQRQRLAYVPQRSQIDWDYPTTAWNVVMMSQTVAAGWFHPPTLRHKHAVKAALEQVGMLDLAHRQIGQLSGGQQQRIFLARALAQGADLYLLDEPFTGVDKKTEALLLRIFDELRSQGKTLLVSCHEWGEALDRYDRLLLLNQKVLADGPPEAVMTLDNLQKAYGSGLQPPKNSQFPYLIAG